MAVRKLINRIDECGREKPAHEWLGTAESIFLLVIPYIHGFWHRLFSFSHLRLINKHCG
jgi:hypothetical protein